MSDAYTWETTSIEPVTVETHGAESEATDHDARFRALRSEVGGDMGRALELLDVSRLRNGAYRQALDVARERDTESATLQARVDELTSELAAMGERYTSMVASRDWYMTQAQALITDPADYRLQPVWDRAAEVADEENFCHEYDRLCEGLGVPGREREWSVPVTVTASFSVTVTARNSDDAAENVDTNVIAERLSHQSSWYISDYINDWEVDGDPEVA